ncbi:MAG TPA: hypothetical protein DDZ51_17320 [Planctomycetaceae bacterium]|nr:hypothetical protein [Planctomycetaceae bacterium]
MKAWTFDKLCRRGGRFFDWLEDRGEAFVGEVPPRFHAWLNRPERLKKLRELQSERPNDTHAQRSPYWRPSRRRENHRLRRDGIGFNGDFAPIILELVAWRMANRNNDFWRDHFAVEFFDEIADGSPCTAVLVPVSQSFPNSLRSAPLLARSL